MLMTSAQPKPTPKTLRSWAQSPGIPMKSNQALKRSQSARRSSSHPQKMVVIMEADTDSDLTARKRIPMAEEKKAAKKAAKTNLTNLTIMILRRKLRIMTLRTTMTIRLSTLTRKPPHHRSEARFLHRSLPEALATIARSLTGVTRPTLSTTKTSQLALRCILIPTSLLITLLFGGMTWVKASRAYNLRLGFAPVRNSPVTRSSVPTV